MKLIGIFSGLIGISLSWDACENLAGRKFASYAEAMACYNSIPLPPSIQSGQIETLKKSLDLYVFLEITKLSPEVEIKSHNNLIQQLEDMEKKPYKGAFELHKDIVEMFLKNQDGHTSYSSPCFEQFIFHQPFPLMAAEITKDGRQVIRVVPKLIIPDSYLEFWLGHEIDVMEFAGQEVNSINAWPVLFYLQHYSDNNIGITKDPNTRLSLSLAHPMIINGTWGIANGMHAVNDFPPRFDSITYHFASGKSVTVPYLVTVPKEFQVGVDYYENYCSPSPPVTTKSTTNNNEEEDDHNNMIYMEVSKIVNQIPDTELPFLRNTRALRGIDEPLYTSQYIHTYRVFDNVGVLVISSFSTTTKLFYKHLQEALNTIEKFPNLILDLSNNGGGVVCFGYHLLDTLTKSEFRFPTDFKLTPLLEELVSKSEHTKSFMDPYFWRRPDFTEFNSVDEFLEPRVLPRGNSEETYYNQLFIDNCPTNPLKFNRNYNQDQLAISTNGICFSTCSLVVNGLQEFHNITSFLIGGNAYQSATVASLAGGTVYSLAKIHKLLTKANLMHHPNAPPPFPLKAKFSFTAREAYSFSLPTHPQYLAKYAKYTMNPLEYTWLPATYHLPSTTIDFYDPFNIWLKIANYIIHPSEYYRKYQWNNLIYNIIF